MGLKTPGPAEFVASTSSNTTANGHEVKERGWRQGSFLSSEAAKCLADTHRLEGVTHAVILSQDCDLVHGDLSVEPFAEVLFLKELDKPNPNFRDGKSSRRLHLAITQSDQTMHLEGQPWNRIRIPRSDLAGIGPDTTITIERPVLRTLIEWVAERYTRTAFPDAFVERMNAVDDELKKLLKRHSNLFWRLFVQVDPQGELASDDEYELSVLCVVPAEVWDDPSGQKQAKEIAEKLRVQLTSEKCHGIQLIAFDVASADEVPLSTLFHYRTWDIFNYLTHRDRLDSADG